MKKLFLIIACLSCIKAHSANISENPESKKRTRKNLFEVGGSAALFFNRQPMSYQSDGWLAWIPIRMEATSPLIPSYIKYARKIGQKTMVGISSYSYGISYGDVRKKINNGTANTGEVMIMDYDDFSLTFDYSLADIRLNKLLSITASASSMISYRTGIEQVYLSQNMFGDAIYTCGCRYNSIGLGAGANVDVVLGNRVYIGGFLGYTHYFEKSRLPKDDSDYMDTYRPNRDVLRLHPKIGVLF